MVKTSSYSAWVLSQGVPAHLEACMEELVISCGFSQQLQIEIFIVLSLLIQVAVTRLGLGMWQTITILQCPPRQTLLPDPTVKT